MLPLPSRYVLQARLCAVLCLLPLCIQGTDMQESALVSEIADLLSDHCTANWLKMSIYK